MECAQASALSGVEPEQRTYRYIRISGKSNRFTRAHYVCVLNLRLEDADKIIKNFDFD